MDSTSQDHFPHHDINLPMDASRQYRGETDEFVRTVRTVKFPSFETRKASSSFGYQQDTIKPSDTVRPLLGGVFQQPREEVVHSAYRSRNTTPIVPPSPVALQYERLSRSESPFVTVTPPQPSTPRTRHSSHTSHPSVPRSSDSFSSIFFRPGNPTASAQPLAPSFFYQQGPRTHSSPDLIGPLLEDYYNTHRGGFQPQAASTPHGSEESFHLAPPGHPSSLPRPALAAPFVFPSPGVVTKDGGALRSGQDPSSLTEPEAEGGGFFKRKAPSFSSLRRWLPGAAEPDVERGDQVDRKTSSGASSRRRSSFSDVDLGRSRLATDASVYPHPLASRSQGTLPRSDLSSSPDITLDIDVFSSNPSHPSLHPVSSPSMSPTTASHSQLMSLSMSLGSYGTPPTPPSASHSREFKDVMNYLHPEKPDEETGIVHVPMPSAPVGDATNDTVSEHKRWSSTTSGSTYIVPITPSPPPRRGRHNPRSLSQRVDILSVIDASPTSGAGSPAHRNDPKNVVEATPTRRMTRLEDHTLGISSRLDKYEDTPLEQYLDEGEGSQGEEGDWRFVHKNPWKDSWDTEVSRTTLSYSATTSNAPRRGSLQSFFRGTRSWLIEGSGSLGTGPRSSYTSTSTRVDPNEGDRTVRGAAGVHSLSQIQRRWYEKSREEIANEEFMSRVSTPSSNEMRTLRSRPHRWTSQDDPEEMSIHTAPLVSGNPSFPDKGKKRAESMAFPISPVSPSAKGMHKHTNTAPSESRSSTLKPARRELVLPRLVEKRWSTRGASSSNLTSQPLSPVSPPPRPRRPGEGNLILTPAGSPNRHYISDLLSSMPQRRVRIISPGGRSSPSRLRNQSRTKPDATPSRPDVSLGTSVGSHSASYMSSQRLSALRMILSNPRRSLDILLPAHVLFLMGFVFGPWVWLIGGWLLGPDGNVLLVDREGRTIVHTDEKPDDPLTRAPGVGDTFESSLSHERPYHQPTTDAADASVTALPMLLPSVGQQLVGKLCVIPISSDSPCDWVWRCRMASIGSFVVLSICVIIALLIAARGHL